MKLIPLFSYWSQIYRSETRRAISPGGTEMRYEPHRYNLNSSSYENDYELNNDNTPDWIKYDLVEPGVNCSSELKLFNKNLSRPVIAISSFPGSGNTWARHLIHMASGYWTGNRRSSKQLKDAGWLAEDYDCMDRRTIAQKTHRLSKNKGFFLKL